jgi:hypothetical protein
MWKQTELENGVKIEYKVKNSLVKLKKCKIYYPLKDEIYLPLDFGYFIVDLDDKIVMREEDMIKYVNSLDFTNFLKDYLPAFHGANKDELNKKKYKLVQKLMKISDKIDVFEFRMNKLLAIEEKCKELNVNLEKIEDVEKEVLNCMKVIKEKIAELEKLTVGEFGRNSLILGLFMED